MTTDQKIDIIYRLLTGARFRSTNGANELKILSEGTGSWFPHGPTGRKFRVGTKAQNEAGTYVKLEDDGNWSSYPVIEAILPLTE